MNDRRRLEGKVTSNKMMKTVVVEIGRTYRHPLYKKVVHSSRRVKAQDDLGCEIGDLVQIVETCRDPAPVERQALGRRNYSEAQDRSDSHYG